jgi:uncharacterized membrane protein YkvI
MVKWINKASQNWCNGYAQRVVVFASKTGFLKQRKVQKSKGKSLDCGYFAYVIIVMVATIYPKSDKKKQNEREWGYGVGVGSCTILDFGFLILDSKTAQHFWLRPRFASYSNLN